MLACGSVREASDMEASLTQLINYGSYQPLESLDGQMMYTIKAM
jgi:hypothetical protein